MRKQEKLSHETDLHSANIVHTGSGNIYGISSFVPAPTIPINGSNLPHRYTNFVGRKDEINSVLEALNSRAWIVTIDAMGGMGKTTLALEVAHICNERNAHYSELPHFKGYIWVSARDKDDFSLRDVTQAILFVLSPFEERAAVLSFPEQVNLAMRALSAEPRLLIIDNFETVSDEPVHRFLRDLPNPSKVLITSRHHIQTGERVITVGGLEENDAVQLLRLEASRLQIPISEHDTNRLHIIARKSYGIPLVLRWVMESVYNGKSLEWILESLEHATAQDIFDYIYRLSLSTVDSETRSIFRSMSLLPAWTNIETIAAINPQVAAVQERVGHLVSRSLMEDNRELSEANRRYRLPPFTQYLAIKELGDTEDKGLKAIECGLEHYRTQAHKRTKNVQDYFETDFINIENLVRAASKSRQSNLLEKCIDVAKNIRQIDFQKGRTLLEQLVGPITTSDNAALTLKLFDSIGNPHTISTPIRNSEMFFGRRDLLKFINTVFESDQSKASVISLIGERRIGKTSLLYQLLNQNSIKCRYILVDLQMIGSNVTTAQFLYSLAKIVGRNLHAGNLEVALAEFKDHSDPYHAFNNYLDHLHKALGGAHLVLVLDEFEALFNRRSTGHSDTEAILNYFRYLVQRGALGIITAGVTPLHEFIISDPSSPFLNMSISKRVSFLAPEEARELIQLPTCGLLKYESEAIDHLIRLSGGHPTLLQHLCYLIVESCRDRSELRVDLNVVESVVNTVYKENKYFFEHLIWRMEKAESLAVATAASLVKTEGGTFTNMDLQTVLAKDGVELEGQELEKILSRLTSREVLIRNDQGSYRFSMEILRHWLISEYTLG